MHTVSWFSAGVSSAVATRLAIDEIDEIIYTHIDDQHEDSTAARKEIRSALCSWNYFSRKLHSMKAVTK